MHDKEALIKRVSFSENEENDLQVILKDGNGKKSHFFCVVFCFLWRIRLFLFHVENKSQPYTNVASCWWGGGIIFMACASTVQRHIFYPLRVMFPFIRLKDCLSLVHWLEWELYMPEWMEEDAERNVGNVEAFYNLPKYDHAYILKKCII